MPTEVKRFDGFFCGGQREEGLGMRGGQNFTPCSTWPHQAARAEKMECRAYCESNSSRTIELDRFNFAVMAMHVQRDGTATDFAILNRGKRAGRSVDDRGEDRSAVGANNA